MKIRKSVRPSRPLLRRLTLEWEEAEVGKGERLPRSVFYKRVVMGELEHARAKVTYFYICVSTLRLPLALPYS